MADDRSLSADEVASRTFATSFRGLDANEVRAFLGRVAEQLQAAADREAALATRLKEAEDRAAHPDIDEDTLLQMLGDETARVMRSAREAAADLKAKAEESVEQILRDAHEEAKRLRGSAESVLAERQAEAEAEAAKLLDAAKAEADGLVASAQADADAALDEVREKAKAMVVEAQAARERILSDLARRRRIAHVQVEQLRAGRDRLLEAYRLVRSTLEEVTEELQKAEAEARTAAEDAARRLAADDLVAEPAPAPEPPARLEVAESTSDADVENAEEAEPAPVLVTTTIEAESPAPVTAEPSRPASVPADERRLSSLRVLKREPEPEPIAEAEPVESGELDVVEPPPADESVRVLEPARMDVEAAEAVIQEGEAKATVESLFARLRASREEEVAHAREVLAEVKEEAPAPAAAAAESAEAPVSDEDERALQERDAAVADIEARLAKKLKRSLQDEQNDVLDRLRSTKGKSFDGVLPTPDEHVARHAAVALPFLQQVGKGADVDGLAKELAESIVQPLRRQLEPALRPPSDDDEFEPADRIGMAYREWKGDRIERLAGDAVVSAWSRAAFAAVPDGTVLRWVVDDGDSACPDCDDNALAGPTAKGEQYPTGQQHPPAHAGCRCLLVRAST